MKSHSLRDFARIACTAACLAAAQAAAEPNPLARFGPPQSTLVNGRWNGVDLERRSNCASEQNNGSRGTYAQFDVSADATGAFAIGQSGITGLDCNYVGRFDPASNRLAVQGTYSCSDGKQGNFQTTSVDVNAVSLVIRMNIQLTGNESCSIDGILGLARQPQ